MMKKFGKIVMGTVLVGAAAAAAAYMYKKKEEDTIILGDDDIEDETFEDEDLEEPARAYVPLTPASDDTAAGEVAVEAAEAVEEAVTSAKEAIADSAADIADSAREIVTDAAQTVKEAASDIFTPLYESVSYAAAGSAETATEVEEFFDENDTTEEDTVSEQ